MDGPHLEMPRLSVVRVQPSKLIANAYRVPNEDPVQRVCCGLSPYSVAPEELAKLSRFHRIRFGIHLTLEHAEFSTLSRLVHSIILLCVCVSTVSFVLETVPSLSDWHCWFLIEAVVFSLFSLEYLLRLFSTQSVLRFHGRWLNVADLLSVLPFFLEHVLAASDVAVLRVFRTVRLVRLLRLARNKHWRRLRFYSLVIALTFKRAASGLLVLAFFVSAATLIFASLFFHFDRGSLDNGTYIREDGSPSPFQSLPETMWLAIQTVTSVGYGAPDAPVSTVGRVVAGLASLLGLLVIALPISILSAVFHDTYAEVAAQHTHAPLVLAELHKHTKLLSRRLDAVRLLTSGLRAVPHATLEELQRTVKADLDIAMTLAKHELEARPQCLDNG